MMASSAWELGNKNLVTEWVDKNGVQKLSIVYGDRIEMNRWLGLYQHWALYIGNGIVANFTNIENPSGMKKSDKVKIIQSPLRDTIGSSWARINNSDDHKYFKPASRADVNQRITHYMQIWPNYNVSTNNCEHFVNYCRYEKRFSKQTDPATNFYDPSNPALLRGGHAGAYAAF